MKRLLILGVFGTIGIIEAIGQPKQWSLRECCDYAVAHNISIKQQEIQCRQQEFELARPQC